MPLASLELPYRAFPSRGAVPTLAGLVLPCGFASDCRRRSVCRSFTIDFSGRDDSLPGEAHPEGEPPNGRMSRDDGSLRSLGRSPRCTRESAPHVPSPSHRHWARRLAAGTPASKLCSPRESVREDLMPLARVRPPAGALLGLLSLQSLLHHGSGSGISRRHTQGAEAPCYVRRRAPSHRGCIPRSGLRRLGSRTQDPPIRRVYRTRRITVRRRPSSLKRLASASAPAASSIRALAGVEDGASCPCPLSAALHVSLPFTSDSPEGRRPLDLEDALNVEPSTSSTPREAGWRPHPSRSAALVPRCRVDRSPTDSRQSNHWRPVLREEQVGGGPSCYQAGRLSWVFVPRRRRLEGAS